MSKPIILTGQGVTLFHLLAQKHAVMLEGMGMRHSRGSVTAAVKRMYGIKGSREKVLVRLQEMIAEIKQGGSHAGN